MKTPDLYQKVKEIQKKSTIFNSKIEEVDGNLFEIFSYHFSNTEDFFIDDLALEMRGLTFLIENNVPKDHFFALRKFFNLGQLGGLERELKELQDDEIEEVLVKEDGSLVHPVYVDGKIYWKTIKSFKNDQSKMANILYKNILAVKIITDFYLEQGITPFFEIVGWKNQIVLEYKKEWEMKLIQLRDKDGNSVEIDRIVYEDYPDNVTKRVLGSDLKKLFYTVKESENTEGVVVKFKSGKFVKIKTDWYCALHGLLTEDIEKENNFLKLIIENKTDDVLAKIQSEERKNKIIKIDQNVNNYIGDMVFKISKKLKENTKTRKEFAEENKEREYFPVMMRCWEDHSLEHVLITLNDFLIRKYSKLEKAREFFNKIL